MKFILLSLILIPSFVLAADLNLDPGTLKLKVYSFSVSKSKFCTKPITVFSKSSPETKDVLKSPTFGNGRLAAGKYKCVIIEMSDNISYTPAEDSDSGGCDMDEESTQDVCQDGDTSTLLDGTEVECDGDENKVALYLSTTVSGVDNQFAFEAPDTRGDTEKGIELEKALKITGRGAGKFIVDASEKLCDTADSDCNGTNSCSMEAPVFSFSKK